jgi:PIN domain nuclease of toxin-antitoxin system
VRLLLDTCAFAWSALNTGKLTARAAKVVESLDTEVFVSSVSAWEIATKTRLGKWPEASAIADNIGLVIRELGFSALAITIDHGQRAGALSGTHKDPFDRLLIAQAQAENLAIVSSDQIFDHYGIRRIW